MFVEIHLLQSFAPSNLNRDDTGSPKDCEFGGVRRARISSQCLKRSIRKCPAFGEATQKPDSTRTRYLTRLLREAVDTSAKPEPEVDAVVRDIAAAFSSKKKLMDQQDPDRTKVALYLSRCDIEWLQRAVASRWDELVHSEVPAEEAAADKKRGKAKQPKSALDEIVDGLISRTEGHSDAPDIALFGRMLADHPETNVDAACQVAHALSTHRVAMEMDFYTAVDDLLGRDEPGAGMMGVLGYNSACYYRYARIDWDQLVSNLGGSQEAAELALKTVDGFLQASLCAVPSGKQNSHAAYNPPSLALAVVRKDGMAWSLANAFEQPVRADRDGGYVAPSLSKLDGYWGDLCAAYGQDSLLAVAALRCGASDVELKHLAGHAVTGEAAWRGAVLRALQNGG